MSGSTINVPSGQPAARRTATILTALTAALSFLGVCAAVGGPASASVEARKALPVYYVGNYLVGEEEPFTKEALYREWKSRRVADNLDAWVRKSVNEMFKNNPVDPDYYGF